MSYELVSPIIYYLMEVKFIFFNTFKENQIRGLLKEFLFHVFEDSKNNLRNNLKKTMPSDVSDSDFPENGINPLGCQEAIRGHAGPYINAATSKKPLDNASG
jgi:hypothetical protein